LRRLTNSPMTLMRLTSLGPKFFPRFTAPPYSCTSTTPGATLRCLPCSTKLSQRGKRGLVALCFPLWVPRWGRRIGAPPYCRGRSIRRVSRHNLVTVPEMMPPWPVIPRSAGSRPRTVFGWRRLPIRRSWPRSSRGWRNHGCVLRTIWRGRKPTYSNCTPERRLVSHRGRG
jgi:hypothetical protein